MLVETPGSFENQSQLPSLLIWAEEGGADTRHWGLGSFGDQREQGHSLGHERQQCSQIKPLTALKGREVCRGLLMSHASEEGRASPAEHNATKQVPQLPVRRPGSPHDLG